jgi:hypothetical protein
MSKLPMLACLALLSAAVTSSSASALSWSTANPGAFSVTDGAPNFIIQGPRGPVEVHCTDNSGAGVENLVAMVSAAFAAGNYGPHIGGCTVAGGVAVTVACASTSTIDVLTTTTYAGGNSYVSPSWAADGGVTRGAQLSSFSCTLSIGATRCSTITGSVRLNITNPRNHLATLSAGRLTVLAAGQSLVATRIGSGCSVIPDGSTTFTSTSGGDIVYTVASPAIGSQPVLWAQ